MLDNKTIITLLQKIITLLTLHDAPLAQIKQYTQMVFFFENTHREVMSLSKEERMQALKMHKNAIVFVEELYHTGTCAILEELEAKTPNGVLAMLNVRGLGTKKVKTLWQEAGIESIVALKEACEHNALERISGFGKKTQEAILQNVLEQEQYNNFVHYSTALRYATTFESAFKIAFPAIMMSVVGEFRRKMEVISSIQWLIATTDTIGVKEWLQHFPSIEEISYMSGPFSWRGVWKESILPIQLLFCDPDAFYQQLVLQTGNSTHLARLITDGEPFGTMVSQMNNPASEDAIYQAANLPTIPPELREGLIEQSWIAEGALPLLTLYDLQGILHVHTTYSDGKDSLETMVMCCKEMGYKYIGITDHSQTAVYAGGLPPYKVYEQHQHIDELNHQITPFKIFKGIESDILPDGSLDYSDEVLSKFDFVIAAVHSVLNMKEKVATDRLIKAISNPFTTILGHLTGRLLLRRRGYPIDHHAIIDACAAYGVVIEINAHPWRLDMDWRWVNYALKKGVKLSINPDAHSKSELSNIFYGVEVARKGGLTKENTLNGLSQAAITTFWEARKQDRM